MFCLEVQFLRQERFTGVEMTEGRKGLISRGIRKLREMGIKKEQKERR